MILHAGVIYMLIIIFCFVVIILGVWYRRPQAKGARGERRVSSRLDSLPSQYKVINDLVLKTNKGYTQIDHVVISNYGVFVIETKNYKGWIFGSETKLNWKQTLYKHSYEFYNPILQNRSHIMALRAQLPDLYRVPFVPIVVFTGNCSLKVYAPNVAVIKIGDLKSTIKSYSDNNIGEAMIELIYKRLLDLDKSQEYSKGEHIQQIRQRKQETQDAIYSGHCLLCGGYLVERKGKFGKFYGCSNYPKCRFTHEL
jgi:hypothetical protein